MKSSSKVPLAFVVASDCDAMSAGPEVTVNRTPALASGADLRSTVARKRVTGMSVQSPTAVASPYLVDARTGRPPTVYGGELGDVTVTRARTSPSPGAA